MPDFITRWAVIGLLILAGIATGTVLGARYELARWEAQTSKDQVVIARVKAARTIKTQEINHETNRFIARSDTYWGVRQSGGAGGLPGSTGIANAASTADAPDSEGSTGGNGCSPADGAADAIVILQWQQWANEMKKAGTAASQ